MTLYSPNYSITKILGHTQPLEQKFTEMFNKIKWLNKI